MKDHVQFLATVLWVSALSGCAERTSENAPDSGGSRSASSMVQGGAGGDAAEAGLGDAFPNASVADRGYRLPAEWEPIESVWLAWTVSGVFYDEDFMKNSARELIRVLRSDPSIRIDLVVSPTEGLSYTEKRQQVEDFLADANEGIGEAAREAAGFIRYHAIPTTTFWMRDMGPVFLKSERGLGMADFGFSYWDYESYVGPNAVIDEAVDRMIAQEHNAQPEHAPMPVFRCSLVSEGGNVQSDGKGTLLINEAVARRRNPNHTLEQIEAEYKRCTGARRILWTKYGAVEDFATYEGFAPGGFKYTRDAEGNRNGTEPVARSLGAGTAGHTDEFAIFGPDNTILLAEVRPADLDPKLNPNPYSRERAKLNQRRMDENYARLRNARNADGEPFRIVRFPMPETEIDTLTPESGAIYTLYAGYRFEDGNQVELGDPADVMAATGYLNVLVTNELVIVPSYYHEDLPEYLKATTRQNDQEVVETFQSLYPERRVVQFPYAHVINYNWYGGGIHCATWQQPTHK